jgi:hypothetical protein
VKKQCEYDNDYSPLYSLCSLIVSKKALPITKSVHIMSFHDYSYINKDYKELLSILNQHRLNLDSTNDSLHLHDDDDDDDINPPSHVCQFHLQTLKRYCDLIPNDVALPNTKSSLFQLILYPKEYITQVVIDLNRSPYFFFHYPKSSTELSISLNDNESRQQTQHSLKQEPIEYSKHLPFSIYLHLICPQLEFYFDHIDYLFTDTFNAKV